MTWFVAIPLVVLILLQGGSGDLSSSFGGGGQLDSTLGVGASRKWAKSLVLAILFLALVILMGVQIDDIGEPIMSTDSASVEADDVQPASVTELAPAPEAVTVEPQPEAEPVAEMASDEGAEVEVEAEAAPASSAPQLELDSE